MKQGAGTSSEVDALTAVLVLRPRALPRNRHFALHATDEAEAARRRASRLRSTVRQITGSFGPARLVAIEHSGTEHVIRYRLARVAMSRTVRVSTSDLAVLRVALAESGTRLLPAPLVARAGDRAHVRALLANVPSVPPPHSSDSSDSSNSSARAPG